MKPSSTPPPNSSRHVLIVDDEPRVRDMLNMALTEMGFTTTTAATAEGGLRAMEQSPADIVLLDLNLPSMSGMEMFHALRRRWSQTQVIILTGFGDLEAAKEAIHMDVVDFLTKPCPLGHIEQALERARQRHAKLVGPKALPPMPPEPPPAAAPAPADSESLEDVERNHILAVLQRHGGNRAATAAELGISLRTLYYRLEKYQRDDHRAV